MGSSDIVELLGKPGVLGEPVLGIVVVRYLNFVETTVGLYDNLDWNGFRGDPK